MEPAALRLAEILIDGPKGTDQIELPASSRRYFAKALERRGYLWRRQEASNRATYGLTKAGWAWALSHGLAPQPKPYFDVEIDAPEFKFGVHFDALGPVKKKRHGLHEWVIWFAWHLAIGLTLAAMEYLLIKVGVLA